MARAALEPADVILDLEERQFYKRLLSADTGEEFAKVGDVVLVNRISSARMAELRKAGRGDSIYSTNLEIYHQYARIHTLARAKDKDGTFGRTMAYVQLFVRRDYFTRDEIDARQMRVYEVMLTDEFKWVKASHLVRRVSLAMFVHGRRWTRDNPKQYYSRRLVLTRKGVKYIRTLVGDNDKAWRLLSPVEDSLNMSVTSDCKPILDNSKNSREPSEESTSEQATQTATQEDVFEFKDAATPRVKKEYSSSSTRKKRKRATQEPSDESDFNDEPEPEPAAQPYPDSSATLPMAASSSRGATQPSSQSRENTALDTLREVTLADDLERIDPADGVWAENVLRYLFSNQGADLMNAWKSPTLRPLLLRGLRVSNRDRHEARCIAEDLLLSHSVRNIVRRMMGDSSFDMQELLEYVCLTVKPEEN